MKEIRKKDFKGIKQRKLGKTNRLKIKKQRLKNERKKETRQTRK